VPVGPGESVATLQTITVSGFTQTDAQPAATKSKDGNELVIKLPLTSNASGIVASKEITEAEAGFDYWNHGFRLAEVWTATPAAGYPTLSGWISITDEIGVKFVTGEIHPPAGASVVDNPGAHNILKDRMIGSKLTVAVNGSIGAAVVGFDLYLRLTKK
jgi:hypothetical protein